MNARIGVLLFVLCVMPVMYFACFHWGWGNDVRSWGWIIGCHIGAFAYAGLHTAFDWRSRVSRAVLTAIYLLTIFSLSCFAIIYGWGMHPRNWWLICIPYAFAAALPPFNTVSVGLLFWRPVPEPTPREHAYIEWLTAGCVEALNALDPEMPDQARAMIFIREQLAAVGNPASFNPPEESNGGLFAPDIPMKPFNRDEKTTRTFRPAYMGHKKGGSSD